MDYFITITIQEKFSSQSLDLVSYKSEEMYKVQKNTNYRQNTSTEMFKHLNYMTKINNQHF